MGQVEEQDGSFVQRNIQYLLVEIYSYAHLAQVSILNMQTLVSSLTECFYPNSSLSIGASQLALSLVATGLCKMQIA